jgi:hypothetical protein
MEISKRVGEYLTLAGLAGWLVLTALGCNPGPPGEAS